MPSFRTIQGGLPPKRHSVLLVEDEPAIRLALATHLEDCGFTVREACSADDAIAILQEPGGPIDLVFSDVRMPGKQDGLDLARWVFENRPNLPVILASGDMGKANAMDNLCGAQAIAKPYDFDAAADWIRQTIEKKRPRTL